MKCPLPQGVSNGADFAPTWVRAAARNTPLGLGDADGGQPDALLAPPKGGKKPFSEARPQFRQKRPKSAVLRSRGSFPSLVGKSPQIASCGLVRGDRDDFLGPWIYDTIGTVQLNQTLSVTAPRSK